MKKPAVTVPVNLGPLIHQTTFAWRRLLNQRLKPLGLSQAKWRALFLLSKAEQPLTQTELATSLEIEPPTMVGLIDRLAREGWVERRNGEDRRVKYLHLTRQAQSVLVSIQKTASQIQQELLGELSPNALKTCMKVLEAIKHKAEQSYG
jgi:MarR family transcriptional regulator, transcriptional regulator for hemolysin